MVMVDENKNGRIMCYRQERMVKFAINNDWDSTH
jgi:hypothetical protein